MENLKDNVYSARSTVTGPIRPDAAGFADFETTEPGRGRCFNRSFPV